VALNGSVQLIGCGVVQPLHDPPRLRQALRVQSQLRGAVILLLFLGPVMSPQQRGPAPNVGLGQKIVRSGTLAACAGSRTSLDGAIASTASTAGGSTRSGPALHTSCLKESLCSSGRVFHAVPFRIACLGPCSTAITIVVALQLVPAITGSGAQPHKHTDILQSAATIAGAQTPTRAKCTGASELKAIVSEFVPTQALECQQCMSNGRDRKKLTQ
jgi:hypothetical protein